MLELDIRELSVALRRGDFSASELTRACLERIECHGPDLNAFVNLTAEAALVQAEAADRRLRA
ncbi:MAG: hypothetical protein R3202_11335, partial [Candidatus Competibacterales bacterium]|nr:hypothetical protein [Candidatus Competibacterales bacterium]